MWYSFLIDSRRLSIARAPQVLCLHLKRLIYSDGYYRKERSHVKFPFTLDLSPYCSFVEQDVENSDADSFRGKEEMEMTTADIQRCFTLSKMPGVVGGSNIFERLHALEHNNFIYKKTASGECLKQSNETGSQLYQLVSVIVHHGNIYGIEINVASLMEITGGHYTCFRKLLAKPFASSKEYGQFIHSNDKGMDEDVWVYISDETSRKANLDEVKQAEAYMLYYEKI